MSQYTVQSILFYFSNLFILCKILGIYPYNLQIFQKYHELKKSTIGTTCVVLAMIAIIILYNLLIFSFDREDNTLKNSQSTLTFVIGIFLTYIGLVMMATDQLTAVRNQKRLGQLYDRIRLFDERLLLEGCTVDNTKLYKCITILVALVFIFELTIMLSCYIVLIDYTKWKSLLWIVSCFPTLYNSLDKIWFAATLNGVQQRFYVINKALNDMVEEHERYMLSTSNYKNSGSKKEYQLLKFSRDIKAEHLNFIYAELNGAAATTNVVRYNNKKCKNKIIPVAPTAFNNFKREIHESQLSNVIKVEEKLNNFCQLHDELCEIGKMLNELWSYPILVLMGYSFLIFTAQLYFLYCATQGQVIPVLFLSAKNACIAGLVLIYIAGKCVYLIYLSWKTSLESKCTGIYLHKCGVVADNNDLYEIVNHLSLKLLNHAVDFTACGFFSLNMETLYGISGGITSYLIILIQFNLAAQQAKDAINSYSANRTSNMGLEDTNTASLKNLISSTIATALTTQA